MTWFVLACLVVPASFLCMSELDCAGASLNAISLSLIIIMGVCRCHFGSSHFDSIVLPNPSRRDVLELANLILGSHGVLHIREPVLGDRSARMRTRKKNGVRSDGQSCGLSSPKRAQRLGMPRVRRNFSIRHYVENISQVCISDNVREQTVDVPRSTSPAAAYGAPASRIEYMAPAPEFRLYRACSSDRVR